MHAGRNPHLTSTTLRQVVSNKKETEEQLDKMIQTLKKEYDRISILKTVHPNRQMKVHVAVVYRLGIEFLQEATVYYSSGSTKRLWRVLKRPPDINLKPKVEAIGDAIKDLSTLCATLDSKRLHTVERKVDIHIEREHPIPLRPRNLLGLICHGLLLHIHLPQIHSRSLQAVGSRL